jgi:hypothetical protein
MDFILSLVAVVILSPSIVLGAKKFARTPTGAGAGLAIGLIFSVLFDPPKTPTVEWRKEREDGEADSHGEAYNDPEKWDNDNEK